MELLAAGILKSGKTVYLKTDGCAKQYKCAEAMYLMCKLAESLGVVIDQMLEVTGHGKDEADGHGGVFKQWLTHEMQRANVSDADLMEVADQVDGREASFATAMTKRAREGFAELKPAGMNSKRRERSNTSKRVFKTYTEADIRDAPAIQAMTDQLARDMPSDADARVKATRESTTTSVPTPSGMGSASSRCGGSRVCMRRLPHGTQTPYRDALLTS